MHQSFSKWSKHFKTAVAAVAAVFALSAGVAKAQPSHPLDALTDTEITQAVNILVSEGKANTDTRYPFLGLKEPAKHKVLNFHPGDPLHRRAVAMVRNGTNIFEAEIDLKKNKVTSWVQKFGVQSPILIEEFGIAQTVALSDPTFAAALYARGIVNFNNLICLPLSAGYYADPTEEGVRLLRVTCLDSTGVTNPWARPIENLTAYVDLENQVVTKVVDSGAIPLPLANGDYFGPNAPAQRPANKPLVVSQPQGVDYTIDGGQVSWDKFKLHFKVEQREGLVISDVRFDNRRVMYQAANSELVVPYGDTTSNFYYRTYMDEGEYGLGKNTIPLVRDIDCPTNSTYYPVTFADDWGNPVTIPDAICIFEQTQHMAWKHFDIFTGQMESRAARELVIRYNTVVGNYEYVFDWTFRQDGSMKVDVGAAGIVETKAAAAIDKTHDHNNESRHATFVDKNLLAVYHQHIFNIRIDMDVDGEKNRVIEMAPKVIANPYGTPRKSGWELEETVIQTELQGRINHEDDSHFIVANKNKKNAHGYATAYEIEAKGHQPHLFASPDEYHRQRAGFAEYNMWVTRYDPDQRYSAGDYVNQSHGGDGLPTWVQANRNVDGKDLVLWVNVGLSHFPRPEDWPVMPTEWFGSLELKPFGFFDRNPTMDLNTAP